jgi:hypothetical protein
MVSIIQPTQFWQGTLLDYWLLRSTSTATGSTEFAIGANTYEINIWFLLWRDSQPCTVHRMKRSTRTKLRSITQVQVNVSRTGHGVRLDTCDIYYEPTFVKRSYCTLRKKKVSYIEHAAQNSLRDGFPVDTVDTIVGPNLGGTVNPTVLYKRQSSRLCIHSSKRQ